MFNEKSVASGEQSGKFLIDWWKVLFTFVKSERLTPPDLSRMYAYVSVAIYEAQICGAENYLTLEGQVNALKDLPRPSKDSVYDWTTVTINAAYYVQDYMMARYIPAGMKAMNVLHDAQIAERAKTIAPDIMGRSKKYGRDIADAIIEWSESDGYEEARYKYYKAPSREGHPEMWEPTDFNQVPLEPFWGDNRPFCIKSPKDFATELKFKYSDDSTSEMWKQAMEVYTTDKNLTEEQRTIALYWADDAGETFTPPGHWISIISEFVQTQDMKLDKATEMYALTAMAMADACITVWYTKYTVDLLRPKTYINEHFEKGWEPYVETPPFSGYTSGHSGFSGSASTILNTLLGDNIAFIDSTHIGIGLKPKAFKSFTEAAREASTSRMYGGIHFTCDLEDGLTEGINIGKYILANIKTNPLRQQEKK
ncbi:MAG: vanadium-dependent haloperoxidase [Dokdonella sp.]|uniref:vanadium-dependent haloperoxidase n=1 Tax=Dokdonella sp. TaxID=2291710 RepID=UPI003BB1FA82